MAPEIQPALRIGNLPEDEEYASSLPAAANYRKATVQGERCGTCIHFLAGACHFWGAKASKEMVCDDWAVDTVKKGEHYATLAEVFHCNGGLCLGEDDDLIWKEALQTGTWAMTPGPGQKPTAKPLVVKYDSDDPRHISLKKLVDHFEEHAVDHVTVPLSHADKVDENTGFVEALKIVPDAKRDGHHKLLAGYRFTEPDIRSKVVNGTIANNSVGILFDYIRKRDGRIFPQVLAHIALTNRPWIDGLQPFGVAASEGRFGEVDEVLYFSAALMEEAPPSPEKLAQELQQIRVLSRRLRLSEDGPLGKRRGRQGHHAGNWVEAVGGLPRYIRRIARDLIEERGMDTSHAIATAISRVKLWAATSKNAKVRAKAAAAVAEWEAKKARSHAKSLKASDDDLDVTELRFAQLRRTALFLAEPNDELLLARHYQPNWWKEEKHPRWPKGHPKGGKFLTKAEIGAAIGGGPTTKRQKDVEYAGRLEKLTGRVKGALRGQRREGERASKRAATGAKPKPQGEKSGYLQDDPGAGIGATGLTSQKSVLNYVNRAVSQPTTTQRYSRIGADGKRKYDASRQELHEYIIDVFMRARKADKNGDYTILDSGGQYLESVDKPNVVFSGGGYAAGKGTILDERMRANGELPGQGEHSTGIDNFLMLDPDQIKAFLPEFDQLLAVDPEANLLVYEEAWDIAQEIQRRAQEKKLHMVVDGISNTSPEEFLNRVRSFTEKGYVDPKVVYVDVPVEEALKRAAKRAIKAIRASDRRHIPEIIMRIVHRDVAATIPGVLARAADYGLAVEVWDNNQGWNDAHYGGKGVPVPPKLIASVEAPSMTSTGGRPIPKIERGSEALWQALLAKGYATIPGISDPGTKPLSHGPDGPPRKLEWDAKNAPKPKPLTLNKNVKGYGRDFIGGGPHATGGKPKKKETFSNISGKFSEELEEAQTLRLATSLVEREIKGYMRGGKFVRHHRRHVKHAIDPIGHGRFRDKPGVEIAHEVARMGSAPNVKLVRVKDGFYRTDDGAYELIAEYKTMREPKKAFGRSSFENPPDKIVGWDVIRTSDKKWLGFHVTLVSARKGIARDFEGMASAGVKYPNVDELEKAMKAQGEVMDWDAVGDARTAMRGRPKFRREAKMDDQAAADHHNALVDAGKSKGPKIDRYGHALVDDQEAAAHHNALVDAGIIKNGEKIDRYGNAQHQHQTMVESAAAAMANIAEDEFIAMLIAQNPPNPGEPIFVTHARILSKLGANPELKHKVIFAIRERYLPVDFVAEACARYRAEHGLPEPQVDILDVPASIEKATAVAKAFDGVDDMADDPHVREAFADFKRQNEEMYDLITRPVEEGGLGITVEFGDPTQEAYQSATAQAEDVRVNRHFRIQSGLGGDHPLMTTEEYDRFRVVHDIFGHVAIGGGFDRHGEYEAWLAHMSMYTGSGRDAMSSEYHGVNSSLWAGGQTATGRAVVLPEQLILNPWNEDGTLRPDHGVVKKVEGMPALSLRMDPKNAEARTDSMDRRFGYLGKGDLRRGRFSRGGMNDYIRANRRRLVASEEETLADHPTSDDMALTPAMKKLIETYGLDGPDVGALVSKLDGDALHGGGRFQTDVLASEDDEGDQALRLAQERRDARLKMRKEVK